MKNKFCTKFRNMLVFSVAAIAVAINFEYAFAQTIYGAQSLGTGQTGRAAVSGVEGPFLNPATLVHTKSYSLNGLANFHQGPQTSEQQLGATFVDNNSDAIVPAAFAYLNTQGRLNDVKTEENHFELSMAQFLNDGLAGGISVLYTKQTLRASDDQSNWNLNYGFLFTPIESLGIGFSAYNILPKRLSYVDTSYAGSVNILFDIALRLRMDVIYQDTNNPNRRLISGIGAESQFYRALCGRLGFRHNDITGKNDWSLGLGWDGPRLAFDYALQTGVETPSDQIHAFDLRLVF